MIGVAGSRLRDLVRDRLMVRRTSYLKVGGKRIGASLKPEKVSLVDMTLRS